MPVPYRFTGHVLIAICLQWVSMNGVVAQNLAVRLPSSNFPTAAGQVLSLQQVQGLTATAYVFLDEGCPICQHYAPILSALSSEFSSSGIRIVGCASSVYADKDSLAHFARDYSIAFPILIDTALEISQALSASVTPQVVVIGSHNNTLYSGRIDDQFYALAKHRPAPTKHELRDALVAISRGKEVVVKQTKVVGCSIN